MKGLLLFVGMAVASIAFCQPRKMHVTVTAAKEVVNARSLGLTGTGDETVKFQRALAAARNKELLIENITIHIRGNLTGNNGNGAGYDAEGGRVRIIGKKGVLKIELDAAKAYPARGFYIRNASEVFISGLEIDCSGIPGGPTSGMRAVYIDGCSNVTFANNYIHNNGHIGLSCVNCSNVTVNNNQLYFLDSAIFLQGNVNNLEVAFNTIKGGTSEGICIFNSDPAATAVQVPRNWIITRNAIEGKTGSYGINVCNATDGIISNNKILNGLGGMMFYDTYSGVPFNRYSTNIEISGNTLSGLQFGINNIGSGFKVHHNTFTGIAKCALMTNNYAGPEGKPDTAVRSANVTIENNIFKKCTDAADPAWHLIQLYNLDHAVFANNSTEQCKYSYPGMIIQKCNDLTVSGNVMKDLPLTLYHQTNFITSGNRIINNRFKEGHIFDANRNKQKLPANFHRWKWTNNVMLHS